MVKVRKADGTLQDYSEEKVRNALKRAGADEELINHITEHIKNELHEGITTEQIYSHIFAMLKGKSSHLVARYNLKSAIMELGPSGYPFEQFVGGILKEKGYSVKVGTTVPGECVYHEIDVIAEKEGKRVMIECKFHNSPGTKSKIQTILYTYARFMDVSMHHEFQEAWLVTNTKVTSEVIDYAKCKGLTVIAWDYPNESSLRKMIEDSNLHPITAVENLSQARKLELISQGIVFAKDLHTRDISL
jgi:hypothetical protein